MPTVTNAAGIPGGVTSENRQMVQSYSTKYAEAVAREQGWAFAFTDTAVTPTGAADRFCRISNTSSDTLVVTRIRIQVATADDFDVLLCANYTSAGTHGSATPVNMNAAMQSSNTWLTTKGDFESDVDITGDSGAVTLARIRCAVADTDYELDMSEHPIIVPGGYSLLLAQVTGGLATGYTVFGYLANVATTDA